MLDAPFGLALAAGMLAAVNPCGFALLPAYLSFLVVGDAAGGRGVAVRRALGATAAMTVGFTAVFGLFGLVLAPVAGQLQRHLPWVTVGVGLLLVGLGGWLLAGRSLPGLRLPGAGRGPAVTGSTGSMIGFGGAYAVASLSCTIGPFLAIVVTSFRAGSWLDGVALFIAYAVGMGVTVGAAALAVALARDALVSRVRRAAALVARLGGALLLIAGGYVAYYGWWEIRVLAGQAAADPIISAAVDFQRWLAGSLDDVSFTFVAVVFAVLAFVAAAVARTSRSRRRQNADR